MISGPRTLSMGPPDAKSQVTIEYDDNNNPVRIDTIVISTQHDEFVLPKDGSHKAEKASEKKMQDKIRDAKIDKVPYMLVVGDREMAANQASVRLRSGEDLKAKPIAEIIDKINEIRLTKSLSLW